MVRVESTPRMCSRRVYRKILCPSLSHFFLLYYLKVTSKFLPCVHRNCGPNNLWGDKEDNPFITTATCPHENKKISKTKQNEQTVPLVSSHQYFHFNGLKYLSQSPSEIMKFLKIGCLQREERGWRERIFFKNKILDYDVSMPLFTT